MEIVGFRDVLDTVHTSAIVMPFTPGRVLQLHRDICRYVPDPGGRWKIGDNSIEEEAADGTRRIRFTPVRAFQTADAMDALHLGLDSARLAGVVDPLLPTPPPAWTSSASIPSWMAMGACPVCSRSSSSIATGTRSGGT